MVFSAPTVAFGMLLSVEFGQRKFWDGWSWTFALAPMFCVASLLVVGVLGFAHLTGEVLEEWHGLSVLIDMLLLSKSYSDQFPALCVRLVGGPKLLRRWVTE